MKKLLLMAIMLAGDKLDAQNISLDKLRPILIAIQVNHLDSSINFYSKYLGLQVAERKTYADHHLEIAILKKEEFELELVKNDSSVNKNNVLKEKQATDITGFAKVNFEVDQLEALYNFFQAEKINMIVSIRQSARNKNLRTFIITDPEGNWLQFTGK